MKNTFRSIAVIFSALTLVLLFGFVQSSSDDTPEKYEIKIIRDISYYNNDNADSNQTKLHLIMPVGVDNPPVFMWIGQGAWAYVNRDVEMKICKRFAENGIAVISVGHRLSPALIWPPIRQEGVKHPEHVKDIAKAFKWVKENASRYSYSSKNIFVGGYSSGAHLAALLAADGSYLQNVGLSTSDIKAIIPVGGGYDIPDYKKAMRIEDSTLIKTHINVVFGETHEEHQNASPTSFLDSFNIDMLMLSENYTYPFSLIFEKALSDRKYKKFQVLNIHNESHGSLWKKLGSPDNCIYRNYMVDYIFSLTD
jgi:hypothetical protein